MKAPLPPDEAQRLNALRQYDVLDTPSEREFDDLAHLAAQICGTPISAITLVDHERQWFKSGVGLTVSETPRDVSFCAHTILGSELLLVPDATDDERFADNPLVTDEPHLRFYAGVPLVTPEGQAIGSLCVVDTVPRQLDQTQQDALQSLGRQAIALLEARPDATTKGQSRQERQQAEQQRRIRAQETARRDVENLKASELRYRRLFEAAKDGILILDAATGQIEDVNPFLCELLGYTTSDFVGKQLWEIGTFRDIAASQGAFRVLQEREYIRYDDLPLETKDGRRVSVEFVSNVYLSGEKKVIQCNIRDLSERKRVAIAEQESQRFLQSTLDALASHIAVLDETGKIIAVNKAWRQFSQENGGTAISCGVGASYVEVCAQAKGAWSEEAPAIAQGIQDVIAARHQTFCLEYPCHGPSEERWFNVCVTRFADEGPLRLVVSHENITERRQAEERTRASETNLAVAQKIAHLGSWGLDLSNRNDLNENPLHWSDEVFRIFGYEPGEIAASNENFFRAVHPDDRAAIASAMMDAIEKGKDYHIEHRIILPDGTERFVYEKSDIVFDESGQPLKMMGTVIDITERKQAEIERDRFFTLSLDMLAIVDSDGYMKRLNPAFEATLGFSDAELMAVPFLEFVHPDDHAATIAEMGKMDSGAPVMRFENRYRCRDGSYKWLLWMAAPFQDLWYCVVHDVTDAKQAEAALLQANDELEVRVAERTAALARTNTALEAEATERQQAEAEVGRSQQALQSFLDAMTTLAAKVAPDGTFLIVNKIAVDASGLSHEVYMKTNFLEGPWWAFDPEVQSRVHARFREAISGVPINYDESIFVFGQVRTISFSLIPRLDAGGKVAYLIAEGRDITALKQTEEALRLAKEEADAANLAKSEFLSRMSHELRTPLNAILGFGQILDRVDLSPISRESVGYILKGGRHLLDLINEVLDIARVEAGRMELSLEPIALADVVPEVCAMMRPLAVERNIRLAENSAQLGRSYVFADLQRLKQVLINLLSNAIKYNRKGGEVDIFCQRKPEGRISIAIRDTGAGLSPHDMAKLFTPFERLGAATSEVEGTGLGLVLSQRLVTAMAGTLKVESVLGRGTTFTIELPESASPEEQIGLPDEDRFVGTRQEIGRTYCVLCVEDNPSNLRLIQVLLQERPEIRLLVAMQGSVGLDLARQHEPDLILLDLDLPDIHGGEVLARLQKSAITRNIPVVIVSADATPNQIDRMLTAGAKAFLTKPLDVALFFQTMNTFLQAAPIATPPGEGNDGTEVV